MSALAPKPSDQPAQAITVPDKSGRVWPIELVAAGCNTVALGPLPTADSKLVGDHDLKDGTVSVEFLPKGPSGNPEFAVTLLSGAVVTVLDEAGAQAYIDGSG
jgi:hypothetical protein